MNTLAGIGYTPFQQSVMNVSDSFNLDITPSGWAFSIWGFIYIWNAAYIAYAVSTAFRDVPPVLNALFFLIYIVSDLLNVTWLYAFTSESIGASCIVLMGNVASLCMLLYVVYRNYSTYQKELEEHYVADSITIKVLVENGEYYGIVQGADYINCVHSWSLLSALLAGFKFQRWYTDNFL